MVETLNELEDKIRVSILNEGKNETIIGGFKISIREEGQIEITELPLLSLDQLELPLKQPEQLKKGDKK